MSRMWLLNLRRFKLPLFLFLLLVISFAITSAMRLTIPVIDRLTPRKIPIYSVEHPERRVAITLDAVWGAENTPDLIELFVEEELRVTFFLGGYWLEEYPELVARLDEAGHEIGNHLYSHPHSNALSRDELVREFQRTEELIEDLTEQEPNLFRPPFGEYNDHVVMTAEELGYQTIMWDIDSLDWRDLDAQAINERVFEQLEPGSIILMHNNGKYTVEALEKMIPRLKEQGYEIVPVSELIYWDNYYIDHAGIQHPRVEPQDSKPDEPQAEESTVTAEVSGPDDFDVDLEVELPDLENEGLFLRLRRRWRGVKSGVRLEGLPVERLLPAEVDDIVDAIAADIERDPDNAYYNPVKDELVEERRGIKVDVDETIERVMRADQDEEVELVFEYVAPEVTSDFFEPLYTLPVKDRQAAFTINVAWGEEHIPEMLRVFADKEVRASFFFTGTWVEKFPELTREIAAAGHEIANHGFRHVHPEDLDLEGAAELISRNEQLLLETTGQSTRLFAPPYGEAPQPVVNAAGNRGYRTVMFSLDTIDWQRPDSSVIYERIVEGIEPGAIVLMHPTAPTVEALPRIIDKLLEMGYELDTVSRLLN